jgi:L-amino acid N-acyltransferase YncA
MRFLSDAGRDFDDAFSETQSDVVVRPAHWGDLPGVSALYNHPEPRWLVKDYANSCFADTRYERHFISSFRATEGGDGAFIVLEADGNRIVGAAALRRMETFHEQHVAVLDFRAAPGALRLGATLVQKTVDACDELRLGVAICHAGGNDTSKIGILEELGFVLEGTFRDRLRDEAGIHDLLCFCRHLRMASAPARPRESYYGEIKEWQRERAETADSRGQS